MVREVAIQNSLQPKTSDRHGFLPPLMELFANRGQRCSHTLLSRQPNELELSLLVGSTTMRNSEEVERFRSALAPLAPTLGRIPAKFNEARFVGMQSQTELAEPFTECIQERSRCSCIFKTHNTVVNPQRALTSIRFARNEPTWTIRCNSSTR